MATLILKNVPDSIYAKLKARAAENRCSVNAEAILCLERVLADATSDTTIMATLDHLRRARRTVRYAYLTDRDLQQAKATGRA